MASLQPSSDWACWPGSWVDARQAAAHFEESLALYRETSSTWGSAVARFNLGFAVQQQDDCERLWRAGLQPDSIADRLALTEQTQEI